MNIFFIAPIPMTYNISGYQIQENILKKHDKRLELNIYQLKWYFQLKIENSQLKMEFSKKKTKKKLQWKICGSRSAKSYNFSKVFFPLNKQNTPKNTCYL